MPRYSCAQRCTGNSPAHARLTKVRFAACPVNFSLFKELKIVRVQLKIPTAITAYDMNAPRLKKGLHILNTSAEIGLTCNSYLVGTLRYFCCINYARFSTSYSTTLIINTDDLFSSV